MKKIISINSKYIGEEYFNKIKTRFPSFDIKNELSYDAEVLMGFPNNMDNEFLDKFTNLKFIQLYSAGFDKLGTNVFSNPEIKLCNARDVHSIPIAEDVILKMLLINRNVGIYYDNMKKNLWKLENNEIELSYSTIGIVGVGSIGKEIAKRLKPFNVKVIGHRLRNKEEENFDEIYTGIDGLNHLLKVSDYVIIAVPLNDETKDLINIESLKLMKMTAVLINIARGRVIKEDDLVYALENKLIKAAALDVTSIEPLPDASKLWGLDNVFISPHNSATSQHTRMRITELIIENLDNYLNGRELKNIVGL